jgi:hypothetical protein
LSSPAAPTECSQAANPLDKYYSAKPEFQQLKEVKSKAVHEGDG